jgi:hypothetical protein
MRPIEVVRNLGGALLYVTEQASSLSAVLEDAHAVHVFELPRFDGEDASDRPFAVHLGSRWALVTRNALPVLRIDLLAKRAFPVDASSIAEPWSYPYVLTGGDRFLNQQEHDVAWRLDATSGQFLPLDFGPGRRLVDAYCGLPYYIARDGRLALPLHDGESAGIFLEPTAGGAWTRLGRPFAGVAFANAEQLGDTWLISTDDGQDTYCGQAIGVPASGAPAGTLIGDALQIVLPARGITRALPLDRRWLAAAHASGLCVALDDGKDLSLYDPVSDSSRTVLSASPEGYYSVPPSAFF